MRCDILFTLTGTDRVGIVEEVSRVLLELGGSVGTSRMARLGGEFAILMLVSLPEENAEKLKPAFAHLAADGYRVSAVPARPAAADRRGWSAYRVAVSGADHEGIVHEIASGLSAAGISIESAETGSTQAPVTGAPLFFMTTLVVVPPTLAESDWIAALEEAAQAANVEVEVEPAQAAN
ncbi:MAG: glycine cleavage system protein R [Coriobacteriia bacterium]